MSLKDAVLSVADEMEAEAARTQKTVEEQPVPGREESLALHYGCLRLRSYARELRTACKAVEGEPPASAPGEVFKGHRHYIEQAKQEIRARNPGRRERLEEEESVRMVVCEGGKEDGTGVSVPPNMSIGAKVTVPGSGEVYQLYSDGKLRPAVLTETPSGG